MIKEAGLSQSPNWVLSLLFLWNWRGQTRAAVEEGEEEGGGSHPRGEEANEGSWLSVVPEKGTALPMKSFSLTFL